MSIYARVPDKLFDIVFGPAEKIIASADHVWRG